MADSRCMVTVVVHLTLYWINTRKWLQQILAIIGMDNWCICSIFELTNLDYLQGWLQGTPDREGYRWSITDMPFDLLWACDSHRKGQIFKYLDAWLHTGRPRKRWLDNITENYEELNLTIHQASRLTNDRMKWRNTVHNKGSRSVGGHRICRRGFKSKK